MDITFNPKPSQISKLYSGRFATPEEKEAMAAREPEDKIEISQEGQDAASAAPGEIGFDEMAEKLTAQLSSMTKDEFMAMVREQLGEPKQLETSWSAMVDPDHSIWTKAYMDSLVSQFTEAQSTVKDYYADAYQDALGNPLGNSLTNQLNYIAAKYQCSWSDYFDASMPAGQRQWAYIQLKAMLTGDNVKVNDPYALPGNALNFATMEETARKAATDKIEELIRQAKEAAGVSLD